MRDQALRKTIEMIIKHNKKLKSLGPTKRPIILNELQRSGFPNLKILELTRVINTYFKK